MKTLFRPLKSVLLRQSRLPGVTRNFSAKSPHPGLLAEYQIDKETNELVRASFSKISDDEKAGLKGQRCLVPISMKQDVHYGTHFAATLSLLNASFSHCSFILADTLQAYSKRIFSPDKSIESLIDESREEGDKWLNENQLFLSKLSIPWKIVRWDAIVTNDDFSYALWMVKKTYATNEKFKQACDTNVMEFLDRNKAGVVDIEKAKDFGLEYILCECAAMFIWVDEKCHWELYPTGRKIAMTETYNLFIKPDHPNFLKPLSLRFKKVSNYENIPAEGNKTNTDHLKKYNLTGSTSNNENKNENDLQKFIGHFARKHILA